MHHLVDKFLNYFSKLSVSVCDLSSSIVNNSLSDSKFSISDSLELLISSSSDISSISFSIILSDDSFYHYQFLITYFSLYFPSIKSSSFSFFSSVSINFTSPSSSFPTIIYVSGSISSSSSTICFHGCVLLYLYLDYHRFLDQSHNPPEYLAILTYPQSIKYSDKF